MKLAKTIPAAAKRSSTGRTAANGAASPVRRVNHGKLSRLAGCWPAAEADRIAAFITENCETVHERD